MEKKNTVLLTVIAIATLLVAVVGATFAYFGASTTNDASSTVQVETKEADVFNATGTSNVSLTVNASDMQQADGNNNYSVYKAGEASDPITISLTAGSGVAICSYRLHYAATNVPGYSAGNTKTPKYKEFGLKINRYESSGDEIVQEWDLTNKNEYSSQFSITAYEGDTVTQQIYLTPIFYNLAIDQSTNAGKTFGGTVTVEHVSCENDEEETNIPA